jgi:uncharacterized protein YeaO (DUF488 family)
VLGIHGGSFRLGTRTPSFIRVARAALDRLRTRAADGPLTLLTATKELDLSQAAVLADLLTRDER